jgi:hypothetical protein
MATLTDSPRSRRAPEPAVPPAMDYASHERTYRRFMHLLKWFVIHLALLLPALYFFIIAGQGVVGTLFLGLALAALGYGVISVPEAAKDLKQTFNPPR